MLALNNFGNMCTNLSFDHKPSIKEIITVIFNYNPNLIDNNREFCHIFDLIALDNGYIEDALPSYWSIGREIFRFKQLKNLSAGTKTNQMQISIRLLDTDKYGLKIPKLNNKPTTAKIIEIIWNNYNKFYSNDRMLVQLFDTIAIKNGYNANELPKYWNIIRAAFNYKKGKVHSLEKNKIVINQSKEDLIPIDYRILDIEVNKLQINDRIKNRLAKNNIFTIKEF